MMISLPVRDWRETLGMVRESVSRRGSICFSGCEE